MSNQTSKMVKMPKSILKIIAVFVIIGITLVNILFCVHILLSWTVNIEMEQYPVFYTQTSDNQERYHLHRQQRRHQEQRNQLVQHELDITALPAVKVKRPKTTMKPQQQQQRLHLRFDWTSLQRYSTLAKEVAVMQQNCSNKKGYFWSRNKSGLGSDLHYYSIALCNALEYSRSSHEMSNSDGGGKGIRVMTLRPWIWYSTNDCSDSNSSSSSSAMKCYFPESEPECEVDAIKNGTETESTSQ